MSEDKIFEQFSLNIFRHSWYHGQIFPFVIPCQTDCGSPKFDDNFYYNIEHAMSIRRYFFEHKLSEVINDSYDSFSKTNLDFYLFLLNNFDRVLPNKTLPVYEKVFLSCIFVFEMGRICSIKGNNIFLYSAPFSWTMFFDLQMKHEFDLTNGWSELEQYAKRYSDLKIFDVPKLIKLFKWSDDLKNCQNLFEIMEEHYEIPLLIDVFNQKCTERQNINLFCPQCEPLFMILNKIANPCCNVIKNILLVEGYLQLFQKMKSEDMNTAYDEAADESEKEFGRKENLENASCDASEKNSAKKEKRIKQEQEKSFEKHYRINAAQKLIQRTFVPIHSSEHSEKYDSQTCIFCDRNVFQIASSIRHDELSDDDMNLLTSMIHEAKELKANAEILSENCQQREAGNQYGAIPKVRNMSSMVDKEGEISISDVSDELEKLKVSFPRIQITHLSVEPQVENHNSTQVSSNIVTEEMTNVFNETWRAMLTEEPVKDNCKTILKIDDPEIALPEIKEENPNLVGATCRIPLEEEDKSIIKCVLEKNESTKETVKTKSKKKKKKKKKNNE